jgi:hypothetical protein
MSKHCQEGYFKHGLYAIRWSATLLVAGLLGLFHALIPILFQNSISRRIQKVRYSMQVQKRKGIIHGRKRKKKLG